MKVYKARMRAATQSCRTLAQADDPLDSLAQEMDKLATVPLLYNPGERSVYSLGHDVQAQLIEVFSGVQAPPRRGGDWAFRSR